MDIVTCDRDWRDYILVEATLPSLHYPHCTLRHGPCCAEGSLHRARRDTQTPAPLLWQCGPKELTAPCNRVTSHLPGTAPAPRKPLVLYLVSQI